jgi:hypothetical protein
VGVGSGQYNSFLVRTWSRDGALVQGQITHVGSRRTKRFRNSDAMVSFLIAQLSLMDSGDPVDPPSEGPL